MPAEEGLFRLLKQRHDETEAALRDGVRQLLDRARTCFDGAVAGPKALDLGALAEVKMVSDLFDSHTIARIELDNLVKMVAVTPGEYNPTRPPVVDEYNPTRPPVVDDASNPPPSIRVAADGCPHRGEAHARAELLVTDFAYVRCCTGAGSEVRCVSKRAGGECLGSSRYSDADRACAGLGGRLCTPPELEAGVCCSTGCGYDGKRVWSST